MHVYIEFDYTDYTRCLAVSILTAFKIKKTQWKVCTIGEKIDQHLHMLRPRQSKLSSLLLVFQGNIEVKQCICIGMRDITQFLNRRDTAKLLIYRCPTLTN